MNTLAKSLAVEKPNPFLEFFKLGYTRLVPIVPPTAEISASSSLSRNIGKASDPRGKAVGVKGSHGKWYGFDWLPYECDALDLPRWHAMGAGVGVKTGNGIVLIDADTRNLECAKIIRDALALLIPMTSIRIGQYPKAGYLIRTDIDFKYTRVEFGERNERGELSDRVEILAEGRQFVAHGIHPKTNEPYTWPKGIPAHADLPYLSSAQLSGFLEHLRSILPAASKIVTEGAAADTVNQSSLKGELQTIRNAVRATPNTSALYPSRESYRDFGYAIKAALPDNSQEAFDLFEEWCARWTDGTNDPDVIASDWRRMKPPFKRGASWLYEQAEAHSDGKFNRAEAWFDALPDEETNVFAIIDRKEVTPPIEWIRPADWEGLEPPTRQWEVKDWIPKGEVTLIYGDGGIGKTLLAHQYATAAAAGLPWLGQETRRSKVLCFFCEDSADELQRRQIDINRALNVSTADIDDHLRISARKYADNLMVHWDRNTGAMKRQPIWEQLRDDALKFGADVVILDTIADTYSGSEIDRAQVSAFLKSCLGKLAQEIGGTVIALGHPSAAGKASGSGTSGSTAWSNAVRSRLYLRYPKGVTKGSVRELEGMKSNYGPAGNLIKVRWDRGAFAVLASTKPQITDGHEPDSGVVVVPSVEVAACDALIAALRACSDQRMVDAPNSTFHFLKVIRKREPGLIEAFDDTEIIRALATLEKAGAVVPCDVGRDASRRATKGYAVVADVLSAPVAADGGIFA